MPTTVRDGLTLHYDSRGDGPAVILHHGLVADARGWDMIGLPDALAAAGARCIALDAAGHGRSDPALGERVGLAARAADVLAVADACGVEDFHYVGYSMGAWIGTGLARMATGRVRSMLLSGWDPVDGTRRFTRLTETAARNEEFLGVIRALTEGVGRKLPAPERIEGYIATYERLFTELPSIAYINGLSFPLMMAVGRDDAYAETVEYACESLDVKCELLSGDHVTAFFDPAYAQAITQWIAARISGD
ncbi:MAG: alpha/beta fold hydrolase [Sphingobium sp.]